MKKLLFLLFFIPSLTKASVIINPSPSSGGGSSLYPSTSTILPSSIRLGPVTVAHSSGTWDVYNPTNTTDGAYGAALLRAFAVQTSSDRFFVSGNFNLQSSSVTLLDGSGLYGAGKYTTSIYSTDNLLGVVRVNDNNTIKDITITRQGYIGVGSKVGLTVDPNKTAFGLVMDNVRINGLTNSLLFNQASTFTATNCEFRGGWGNVFMQNSTGVFNNSTIFTRGDNAIPSTDFIDKGIYCGDTCLAKLNNTDISMDNGNVAEYGVYVEELGKVYLSGGSILTTNGSVLYDFFNNGGEIRVTANTIYDTSKVSGTPIYSDALQIVTSASSISGDSTKFLNGQGSFTAPAGGSGSSIYPSTGTNINLATGVRTSSITVEDTNSNQQIYVGTLPINSGAGPQVVSDGIWNKTNFNSGTYGSYSIVLATTDKQFTAGGAPVVSAQGGAFYLTTSGISFAQFSPTNRTGSTAISFDTSGLNVYNGNPLNIYNNSAVNMLSLDFNDSANYVTLTTTAPLTVSASSMTVTSTVAVTGALRISQAGTTAIVIGDLTGNSRGTSGTDIQSIRSTPTRVASGTQATAVGNNNTASGIYDTAVGAYNDASLEAATAVGYSNTAGVRSAAFGYFNSAINYSSVFGYSNTASGDSSNGTNAVFGYSNSGTFNYGYIFGKSNVAGANNVQIFGEGLTNALANSTMIGPSDSAKMTLSSDGRADFRGIVQSTGVMTNGAMMGLVISTFSPTGAYTITATTQTITIGSTQASSMTVTLTSSGTYTCEGYFTLLDNGATFAANRFVTYELYRQNNTPGIIPGTLVQPQTGTITTVTGTTQYRTRPADYSTLNTNDVLSLQISIDVIPTAGSIQAKEAGVYCTRRY